VKIRKAVITAAGRNQRSLALQQLVDRDGEQKSVLRIIVVEALDAGMDEIYVIIHPDDQAAYEQAVTRHAGRLEFVPQTDALGYGHALYCAREFVAGESFLHLVGDHLHVGRGAKGCARQLVESASAEDCAVSAVQHVRESQLPYYGTVGGRKVPGRPDLYTVEQVIEKPSPTLAEEELMVPGVRVGHYLSFFGVHVLTPTVMEILTEHVTQRRGDESVGLSRALAELASRERYLASGRLGWCYDVGVRYGILKAQLALALCGNDRDEVLSHLVELLAQREHGGATV